MLGGYRHNRRVWLGVRRQGRDERPKADLIRRFFHAGLRSRQRIEAIAGDDVGQPVGVTELQPVGVC